VIIYNLSMTPDQVLADYEAGIGRHNFTVSEETSKHEYWNVSATPVDSRGEKGDTVYSYNVTIENTPPDAPTLIYPDNGNMSIMTRLPVFNWTDATDVDGDAVTYRLNITHSTCPDGPVYTGIPDSNKTPEQELNTSDECSGVYNWTVEAYDSEDYGPKSESWNFSIMPILILYLHNPVMDFGNMLPGYGDNTTEPGSAEPFVLENMGTVFARLVNVTADSDLWSSDPSPTENFQLKVSDNETGSVNLSGSATTWTDVSLPNITIIEDLNYTDSADTARIDIRIQSPSAEPKGLKSVNLTFWGEQA